MFGINDGRPSAHAHAYCLRNEQCTCTFALNLSHCWMAVQQCQGPGSDS